MPLKQGGLVDWFVARKLHGVRLLAFTHFLARANQTCCAGLSDSEHLVQLLAYALFLLGVFNVVLLQ
jgi:DNA-binding MurR/RpiR family transcriptional regulator